MKKNEKNGKKTRIQPGRIKPLEAQANEPVRIRTGVKAGTIGPVTPW